MSSEFNAGLDLHRVGEQIDVILTEIYGKYVAKGSPTKLGGLRFLDVDSAKTFAFEKSRVKEAGQLLAGRQASHPGCLLVLSAPFGGKGEAEVKAKLEEGPHAEDLAELQVRASADAGKKGKYFVEAAYYLDAVEWLKTENLIKVCEEHHCNGNDAVMRLLKQHVLPRAAALMDHFIHIVRSETIAPTVASF